MRKMIVLLLGLLASGCATLSQLNSNMVAANDLVAENIRVMETSKAAVLENTQQIKRSTEVMRDFQFVFPIFFSILLIIFIYLLFKLFRMMLKKNKT